MRCRRRLPPRAAHPRRAVGVFARAIGNGIADNVIMVGVDLNRKLDAGGKKAVYLEFQDAPGFVPCAWKDKSVGYPVVLSEQKAKYLRVKNGRHAPGPVYRRQRPGIQRAAHRGRHLQTGEHLHVSPDFPRTARSQGACRLWSARYCLRPRQHERSPAQRQERRRPHSRYAEARTCGHDRSRDARGKAVSGYGPRIPHRFGVAGDHARIIRRFPGRFAPRPSAIAASCLSASWPRPCRRGASATRSPSRVDRQIRSAGRPRRPAS